MKAQKASEVGKDSEATLGAKRERQGESTHSDDEEDDWDELAREERMAKKLKKGEVSQREFDVEFADL